MANVLIYNEIIIDVGNGIVISRFIWVFSWYLESIELGNSDLIVINCLMLLCYDSMMYLFI